MIAEDVLGSHIVKYESGTLGPGAISTGSGDPGGKSYGLYQLASKAGTLIEYLKWSKYGNQFSRLVIGGEDFDRVWKRVATQDPAGFAHDQHAFITKSHYEPVRLYADTFRIPHTRAINETLFSMSVQHGKAPTLVWRARLDPSMSEETMIRRLYDVRRQYVMSLTSLSNHLKQIIMRRYEREEKEILSLLGMAEPPYNPTQPKVGKKKLPAFIIIILAIVAVAFSFLTGN